MLSHSKITCNILSARFWRFFNGGEPGLAAVRWLVTACWNSHEREQWMTTSERKLQQYRGGWIPGPSWKTTGPSLQAKRSSDIRWRVGTQIAAWGASTFQVFVRRSSAPLPSCETHQNESLGSSLWITSQAEGVGHHIGCRGRVFFGFTQYL